MVDVGQRASELSKQALKIFQQIANNGSSQYLYFLVASSAGGSGVAARFSKLLCKPPREETEMLDAGQRACGLSRQALKIFRQMADDVAFGEAWLRVGQRSGLRGGVAAGGAARWPSERRGCEWGSEVAFGEAWLRVGQRRGLRRGVAASVLTSGAPSGAARWPSEGRGCGWGGEVAFGEAGLRVGQRGELLQVRRRSGLRRGVAAGEAGVRGRGGGRGSF